MKSLIEAIKEQIKIEDAFSEKHRAEGDFAKMRACRNTSTVLKRLLRNHTDEAV